ncbi:MAG TPA: GNAT family N-acetyltransferase [Steroidobacteraceae bacterium]|nr:GNAT family N-acetyltransferase [Steroidobacteraceae bacterium]
MPQVSVREPRAQDRAWIRGVYRDYLFDLAPAATGLFPLLSDAGQRETEQADRLFADAQVRVLAICYAHEPVGFARISMRGQSPPEFSMADFFIARAWRRRGIGAEAVRLILDRFEGAWLITEHLRNDPAVQFWRQVVGGYTAGKYQERIVNGEVQQRFASGPRRTR